MSQALKSIGEFVAKELDILIVDDSEQDRKLLIEYLDSLKGYKGYDFNIVQVNSPRKALEILANTKFDLMFLDFMMDEGDGLSMLVDLTKEQKEKTPIIFLTGLGNGLIKEDSLAIGAKEYLNKNEMSFEVLEDVLSRTIH